MRPTNFPRRQRIPSPIGWERVRVRIPRTDTSRIEPLNHDAFVRLPLLLERGEGWGEESTSFEGFMGRGLRFRSNCVRKTRPWPSPQPSPIRWEREISGLAKTHLQVEPRTRF